MSRPPCAYIRVLIPLPFMHIPKPVFPETPSEQETCKLIYLIHPFSLCSTPQSKMHFQHLSPPFAYLRIRTDPPSLCRVRPGDVMVACFRMHLGETTIIVRNVFRSWPTSCLTPLRTWVLQHFRYVFRDGFRMLKGPV